MMILVYILFILYFVPVILAMTGIEVGIAKIFFRGKSERKVGKAFPLTLYIFGAIAFWVTASFLLFFQKALISYFNLGDHQFIFNAYILSGVLCYAGYLSLNSENYDKENPTIYSRTAMFTYLLISAVIILSVFLFFGLSLVGFASSAQRAVDILDKLVYLCISIFVIVYGWYLINRFCARYFSMAKILKVNMIVFIIYFIATPAYLYGTKYYTEYKQDHSIYTINLEFKNTGQKFQIKTPGKFLKTNGYLIKWYCNKETLVCNVKDESILFDLNKVLENGLSNITIFSNYKKDVKIKGNIDKLEYIQENNIYLPNCFYNKKIYSKNNYNYIFKFGLRCENKDFYEKNKNRL
ncbi:hypothetical protein AB4F11_04200 [Francisella philomiragia]